MDKLAILMLGCPPALSQQNSSDWGCQIAILLYLMRQVQLGSMQRDTKRYELQEIVALSYVILEQRHVLSLAAPSKQSDLRPPSAVLQGLCGAARAARM